MKKHHSDLSYDAECLIGDGKHEEAAKAYDEAAKLTIGTARKEHYEALAAWARETALSDLAAKVNENPLDLEPDPLSP